MTVNQNLVTGERGNCRALPVGVVREWQCRGIWGQLMTPGVWRTGAVTSSVCVPGYGVAMADLWDSFAARSGMELPASRPPRDCESYPGAF